MPILLLLITILLLGIVAIFFVIYLTNRIIIRSAKPHLFDSINDIDYNRVGVVLGTTKYLHFGPVNLYYKYRMDATVLLFKSNKIKYVIVSGDSNKNNFNEPEQMKADLIREGIEEDKIFLDYGGYRTLDSMLRVAKAFGETKVTLISQKFHNERAVYIAKRLGMDVIGFNAKDPFPNSTNPIRIREKIARVKVFYDFFLTNFNVRTIKKEFNIPA